MKFYLLFIFITSFSALANLTPHKGSNNLIKDKEYNKLKTPQIPFHYSIDYSTESALLDTTEVKSGSLSLFEQGFSLKIIKPLSQMVLNNNELLFIEFAKPKNQITKKQLKGSNHIVYNIFHKYDKFKVLKKYAKDDFIVVEKKINEYIVSYYFKKELLSKVVYFDNVDSTITINLIKELPLDKSLWNYRLDPNIDQL